MEISNYINAPYNKGHDNVLFKYRKSNFKCFYLSQIEQINKFCNVLRFCVSFIELKLLFHLLMYDFFRRNKHVFVRCAYERFESDVNMM